MTIHLIQIIEAIMTLLKPTFDFTLLVLGCLYQNEMSYQNEVQAHKHLQLVNQRTTSIFIFWFNVRMNQYSDLAYKCCQARLSHWNFYLK